MVNYPWIVYVLIKAFPHAGGCEDWKDGALTEGRGLLVSYSRTDYFPFGCQVCKRLDLCDLQVSKCSRCKRVYYCGRKHQTADWSKHKRVCKAMSEVPLNKTPTDKENWEKIIKKQLSEMGTACSASGGMNPWNSSNFNLWIYQPHCQNCFVQVNLTTCKKCCSVAHCQRDECIAVFNVAHSTDACEAYCVRLASYVMALQQGTYLKVSSQTRSVVNLPPTWEEYFKQKLSDFEVPRELLRLPPVMAQLTDGLSSILTAVCSVDSLYGSMAIRESPFSIMSGAGVDITLSASLSALKNRSKVSIHFIGAELRELIGMESAVEEVLHWLPECRTLDIVLVGPNLPALKGDDDSDINGVRRPSRHRLCDECACNGCSIYMTTIQQLYHEAVDSGLINASPTLSVCLNSGLHEESSGLALSWQPTVELLYRCRTPTVFTAYCAQEIYEDAERVKSICAAFQETGAVLGQPVFCGPSLNPYRGLLPMPDPFQDNVFFYSNSHVFSMV